MMSKQTLEFVTLIAKLPDSIFASLADGKFSPLQDFQHFIDDLLAAQPAIEGVNEIPAENSVMALDEMEIVRSTIFNQLGSLGEKDRRDLTAGIDGLLSIFRMAWRNRHEKSLAEGKEIGRQELIEQLRSGTVSLDSIV